MLGQGTIFINASVKFTFKTLVYNRHTTKRGECNSTPNGKQKYAEGLLLQFYCVINSFQDNQLELIGAITLM
jgi:hypothetical protein